MKRRYASAAVIVLVTSAVLFVFVVADASSSRLVRISKNTISISSSNGFRWRTSDREGDPSPKLHPWELRTIAATVLAGAGAALSSAGGIGGGGLYVPMFNLLLGFNTRTAAVLSNFMIFGGMLANMIWSAFQRHPDDASRPLIDMDAALLMQPCMLLGISMGVFCNVMFPGWLITAMLALTLGLVTFRSCRCGLKLWKDESYLNSSCLDDDHQFDVEKSHSQALLDPENLDNLENSCDEQANCHNSSSSWCTTSMIKLVALVIIWFFFFQIQLLRGSKTNPGFFNLKACGTMYWLITLSQIPSTLLFTTWTLCYLHKYSNVPDNESGVDRDKVSISRSKKLPIMALLAGILGGLLGIGGGMLINPILLGMGMTPQVTAATCAFMVFFSSSLSVVQYWLMGRIPVAQALYFSAISFVFSLVGLLVVQRAVVRSGRTSIIVFLVSTVMGLSAILLASFGGLDVWKQYSDGDYMGFRSPC